MPFLKLFKIFCGTLVIASVLVPADVSACSLVKITVQGKTVIGNNEDFSNPDTRIWFEPGDGTQFGAAYVGYDNLFPEGGMNEAGLVFDAFGLPDKPLKDTAGKTPVFQLDLKRKIMRECSTVEQVKSLLAGYNLYFWSHAAWVFLDASGKYLVVDGDSRVMGDNACFVQTNFRQSEITDEKQIVCPRYKKLMSLLRNHNEASIGYCTALMDSVHTDGTLYTTIYDTQNAVIDLYYSHNYSKKITFRLKDELKKGARILIIPELFPEEMTGAYKGYLRLKKTIDELANAPSYRADTAAEVETKNELKKLPYLEHVLGNHGYELLHQNKTAEAIAVFRLCLQFYPKSADAYDFIGEAFLQNSQYKLALSSYMRSVDLDPDNVNGRQRIAQLHALMKQSSIR